MVTAASPSEAVTTASMKMRLLIPAISTRTNTGGDHLFGPGGLLRRDAVQTLEPFVRVGPYRAQGGGRGHCPPRRCREYRR